MERRQALQASLAGAATILVPSLAAGYEVPDEDHVILDLVDYEVRLTFVGEWLHRVYVEQGLRDVAHQLYIDPDFQAFTNFPIVCLDPAIQKRITLMPGASEEEINAAMVRWEREHYEPLE